MARYKSITTIFQDFILLWQDIADRGVIKQSQECFLHPACGCQHPGKLPQCEDCPTLEACLSRSKYLRANSTNTSIS